MPGLLTGAQVREIERRAIRSGFETGLDLMENAGRGVVKAILSEWPEAAVAPHRAIVLCGPGNNGGDGFVIARLLKDRGWEVQVWFHGSREDQPADAGQMHDRWIAAGGEVFAIPLPFKERSPRPYEPWRNDLEGGPAFVIDAMFGIGLARPIDEDLGVWRAFGMHFEDAREIEDIEVRRVAVDVPSGLCADSGRVVSPYGTANFRPHFRADLTVATGFLKIGHFLAEGPEICGKVVRVDIGSLIDSSFGKPGYRNPAENAVRLMVEQCIATDPRSQVWLRRRFLGKGAPGQDRQHKYTHGHALILSGPPGHTGAARLAARGALRIGAGLVTVGAMPEAIPEHAAQLNAIMLRAIADGGDLVGALADPRITALCLGPGLGLDERARGLVAAALGMEEKRAAPGPAGGARSARPVGGGSAAARRAARRNLVLDADALTILSQSAGLFAVLHESCVLTPHAGEFARLFPDIAEKLAAPASKGPAYSKVDATRAAARRAGCVVLYKGPDTVIADPYGRCSINSAHYDRAAPWLATAGSGDVLSGFIAGLLARGFTPMAAAETAAWLHVECALIFGPGLIAEDLPEQLPAVFRKLGLQAGTRTGATPQHSSTPSA